MLLLDLPDDLIYYILSMSRYDDNIHIMNIKQGEKYFKFLYSGEWYNDKFHGYGKMNCKEISNNFISLEEPININVLNVFYKYYKL